MKKIIFILLILGAFISCSKGNEKKTSLWEFFPDSTITYTGGFENSNYTIVTKKFSEDIVIQTIETTGTTVTKVIKISDNSASVVFLGEEVEQYSEDMNNLERMILKLPLEKGNSWESDENSFSIEEYDGKTLLILREFEGGEIRTTYEAKKGMIRESFSSEGFNKISEIIHN